MNEHAPHASPSPVGRTWTTASRTVTEGECTLLASLAWTRGPLHTDLEFARQTPFGGLILPGPLVAAVMSGLWASCSLMGDLERDHDVRLLAVLGGENQYRLPLHVGDTIHSEIEVSGFRPSSSRPGQGILTLRQEAINQAGQQVAVVAEAVLCQHGTLAVSEG